MKAYLLISGVTISPFGQSPGAGVRVLNRSLVDYQTRVLSRLKIKTVPVTDISQIPQAPAYGHLVILEHLFFTHQAMTSFLNEVRMTKGDAVLTLPDSAFSRETQKFQDDRIVEQGEGGDDRYVTGIFLMKDTAQSLEELRTRARRVVIPLKEEMHRLPDDALDQAGNPDTSLAFTREAVAHVCHWPVILDIHRQALMDNWLDLIPGRILSNLWRRLTTIPKDRYELARRFTCEGKRCDIHPTAVVEGSVLGDGVKIGPHAVVRGSVIGNGVRIEENAQILGCCLGHDAVVGADVKMAGGLELPNGGFLVSGPEDLSGKIHADRKTGEPLVIRDGRVVPLREVGEKTG